MENRLCHCGTCIRHRHWKETLERLGKNPLRDDVESLYDKLDMENEHLSTELGRLNAILSGNWPDSELHMKAAGWVKDPEYKGE